MAEIRQVRKGSTPLLILSLLEEGPKHGYAIMRRLEERSQGYFTMTAALLYPTIHEMEMEGLVTAEWIEAPGQRRRKVYSITPNGRQQLTKGQREWRQFFNELMPFLKLQSNPEK